MQQVFLSMLVSNHFGVLAQVTGLFGRRGYNIRELTVGETEDPVYSRITLLVEGTKWRLEPIIRQLNRLEDVKKAIIIPQEKFACSELILVKTAHVPDEVLYRKYALCEMGNGEDFHIFTVTGTPEEMEQFLKEAETLDILELCRSGGVALEIGRTALKETMTQEDT